MAQHKVGRLYVPTRPFLDIYLLSWENDSMVQWEMSIPVREPPARSILIILPHPSVTHISHCDLVRKHNQGFSRSGFFLNSCNFETTPPPIGGGCPFSLVQGEVVMHWRKQIRVHVWERVLLQRCLVHRTSVISSLCWPAAGGNWSSSFLGGHFYSILLPDSPGARQMPSPNSHSQHRCSPNWSTNSFSFDSMWVWSVSVPRRLEGRVEWMCL